MWLARCSGSHECVRGKKQHRPPTRLVSIGHGAVKLVVTASLPMPPTYATLSYCWGSEPFTMLTNDNMDMFLDHIPLGELPRTFSDAIHASRRLGIDYIWIDSLCIIQQEENNRDWAREAGHMSAVYGGSFINLAASTATSVREGFLRRPKHYSGGFVARVTTNDFCRLQSFHSRQVYRESTADTYLATRAWAFQEKLLSPRTIYFGDSGLFWECRHHISSEFIPEGFSGMPGQQLVVDEDKPLDWRGIVEEYSQANLTYGSDRLPALSGVAARQQQVTGDQYLAGMWRESLITQLPWELVGAKSRRPDWRAPTWSWASIDGEARYWGIWNFEHLSWNKLIQVLEARTRPSGPDPYGAVTDGELIVSCTHLVRCYIHSGQHGEEQDGDSVRIEPELGVFPVKLDCLGEPSARSKGVVYMLPVIEGDSGSYRSDPETGEIVENLLTVQGLVLQACEDFSSPRQFQRIGSFALVGIPDGTEYEGVLYRAFMGVLRTPCPSMAVSEPSQAVCSSENQDGRLVITIK